jgi:hypothetical protein
MALSTSLNKRYVVNQCETLRRTSRHLGEFSCAKMASGISQGVGRVVICKTYRIKRLR